MLIENISISCCVWTKPFAEEKKTINKIKIKGRKLPSKQYIKMLFSHGNQQFGLL